MLCPEDHTAEAGLEHGVETQEMLNCRAKMKSKGSRCVYREEHIKDGTLAISTEIQNIQEI